MANKPGWYLPEDNSHFTYKLPLYGTTVTIDTVQQETKVTIHRMYDIFRKIIVICCCSDCVFRNLLIKNGTGIYYTCIW